MLADASIFRLQGVDMLADACVFYTTHCCYIKIVKNKFSHAERDILQYTDLQNFFCCGSFVLDLNFQMHGKRKGVPEKWKHLRPRTLEVLRKRGWHDPRKNKYGAIAPLEKGRLGKICTSIAFFLKNVDEGAAIFSGAKYGLAYSGISMGSPAVYRLSQKLLDLELGEGNPMRNEYDALLTASGMSAISILVLSLLNSGDEFISSPYLYGGTYEFFNELLPEKGIKCFMVDDPRNLRNWEAMVSARPRAKFLFAENGANPTPFKLDNQGIAAVAHARGKMYFCDNTIQTPILSQPILEGADGVVHSASKNIGGHSAGLGGAIISKKAMIEKARNGWFKATRPVMDARVAEYMMAGLADLRERMEEKAKNAAVVVEFLNAHPAVKKVHWSGSDLLSFEISGSLEDAKKVVESFKFILLAPHLGDDYPLGIHPASMTHAKIPEEERAKLGISDALIRLSPGLCDPLDVNDDLKQAMRRLVC